MLDAVPANLQAVTSFIDGGLYTGFSLMSVVGLAREMTTDPQVSQIMAQNNLGQQGRHPEVPILIASSWGNDVIHYQTNRQLAADYCQQGSRVTFYTLAGVTHVAGIFEGIPRGLIFLDRQFKGLSSINSCWQF